MSKEVGSEQGRTDQEAAEARSGRSSESRAALRLEGMRTVVTGASSGIGRAIALAFAREGADVVVTYRRSAERADAVAGEIEALGRQALVLQADIAREAEVERLVESAFDGLGRVDAWVNNAGADILTGEGARSSDRDKLDRLLAVDLRGTVLASWLVAERMRRQGQGVLLNVSWDQVLTGMAGREAEMFSAVKGGILSFSKSLARSMAPEVRVNVLAPGWISTAFGEQLDTDAQREIARQIPLGRWGTPEDVAHAAVYLASPQAAFLTGTTLPVSGGIVM